MTAAPAARRRPLLRSGRHGPGEVAPDARLTHRNGYRPRPWETGVGEIELLIPATRAGSYFPSFLEPRRRSEQAICAVVMEAYVNGGSTRKVDRVVEQLGIEGMTNPQASMSSRRVVDRDLRASESQ